MQGIARRLTAVLCGLAVAAGTVAAGITAANASGPVLLSVDNIVQDSNRQQIIDVFNGINRFRASKGISAVRFSVPISSISQRWSDTMAASDTFYHNPGYTNGAPPNWSAASEIIAARWDRSGQGLVDQWINSPGHNAIMSDPKYNIMGIGVTFTDMSPTGTTKTRYGMYGTANLFRYAQNPVETYASPADYFAGRPPATAAPSVAPAARPGDMLAVDGSGTLWNYGNRATTGRRALASSGWSPVKSVFVTDWNADGIQDVVAQWKAGNLTVSYGTSAGTLSSTKVIGTGWGSYEVSVAKYNRADKFPSLIAKDTAGYIWQYTNPAGSAPGYRVLKGSGWKYLQVNVLDWDKDGNMDIIAKNTAGSLLLYRTNGSGTFINEARKMIGSGWSPYHMESANGYAGAGTQGVLAKDSKGNLYYYGTGKGAWLARVSEGAGWLPMNVSSS